MKTKVLEPDPNEICVKKSIRRKRFDELSRRQKNRIRREMKINFKSSNFPTISLQEKSNTKSDIFDAVPFENKSTILEDFRGSNVSTEYYLSDSNLQQNDLVHNDVNGRINEKCEGVDEDPFFNDFLFRNVYTDNDVINEYETKENEIRDKLRKCFLLKKIKPSQGTAILKVLKTVPALASLPSDCRALYQTPREKVPFKTVQPGLYLHIGFKNGLENILKRTPIELIPQVLSIDISTDGVAGDKQNRVHYWPIQIRIFNINDSKPEVIGIYRGAGKPSDIQEFFADLNAEATTILQEGGFLYNDKIIPISFRAFIADAPARALILNHKGHNATNPCSKCKISGEECVMHPRHPLVYVSENDDLRTHEEYVARDLTDSHFKSGKSPLEVLFPNLVQQVVFEYMHSILLGLTKKFLSCYILGKFNKQFKLSHRLMEIVSVRLSLILSFCPQEFSRKPISLIFFLTFKATEFRLILLYTGMVVFNGILKYEAYAHFLLFHAIIRCLTKQSISESDLEFCKIAVKEFIPTTINLFGETVASYNLHIFYHIVDDVQIFGSLDKFSAFPYETNVASLQRWATRPGNQLTQMHHRFVENQFLDDKSCSSKTGLKLSRKHSNGPVHKHYVNSVQYQQVEFKKFFISLEQSDNCIITVDDKIGLVVNIISNNKQVYFLIQFFNYVDYFYDLGILSTTNGIYKCGDLGNEIHVLEIDSMKAKCFRMPYWESGYFDPEKCLNYDRRQELDQDEDFLQMGPVQGVFIIAELF